MLGWRIPEGLHSLSPYSVFRFGITTEPEGKGRVSGPAHDRSILALRFLSLEKSTIDYSKSTSIFHDVTTSLLHCTMEFCYGNQALLDGGSLVRLTGAARWGLRGSHHYRYKTTFQQPAPQAMNRRKWGSSSTA